MQVIDIVLTVLPNDFGSIRKHRHPITSWSSRLYAIHRKATGQTRHAAKDAFKRFRHVMTDKVLKDLDPCNPRFVFVRDACFAADADDQRVV